MRHSIVEGDDPVIPDWKPRRGAPDQESLESLYPEVAFRRPKDFRHGNFRAQQFSHTKKPDPKIKMKSGSLDTWTKYPRKKSNCFRRGRKGYLTKVRKAASTIKFQRTSQRNKMRKMRSFERSRKSKMSRIETPENPSLRSNIQAFILYYQILKHLSRAFLQVKKRS